MRSNPISVVDPAASEGDAGASGRILRFSYLFYVDLVASTADVNTQNALRHLQARRGRLRRRRHRQRARADPLRAQEMAPFMRVLGCYPMDNTGRFQPNMPPQMMMSRE